MYKTLWYYLNNKRYKMIIQTANNKKEGRYYVYSIPQTIKQIDSNGLTYDYVIGYNEIKVYADNRKQAEVFITSINKNAIFVSVGINEQDLL